MGSLARSPLPRAREERSRIEAAGHVSGCWRTNPSISNKNHAKTTSLLPEAGSRQTVTQ